MSKIIRTWWVFWVGLLLAGITLYGYSRMYFHQDDLDWLLLVNHPFWQVMAAPIGDHIDYLFRLLFFAEWHLFGFHFPPYLFVSVGLHALVIWLLYRLSLATSGRRDLSAIAALLFTINTNWTEVVLWTSGQTISISVVFILLSMWAVWQKRGILPSLFLSTWTSALALGLPIATFLVYGVDYQKKRLQKTGWGVILVFLSVAILYRWRSTDGTPLQFSWPWVLSILEVWVLAIFHSVIGRFFIPFDHLETIRLWFVAIGSVAAAYIFRAQFLPILKDTWSRFLLLQLGFYYLIVAVGRAQYGVGIMRAERYTYLGLALVLLLLVWVLRSWKIGKWVWTVPFFLIIQCLGFYTRAQAYVVRPEALRALVAKIVVLDPHTCYRDRYLPHFVLNDERLTYADLMRLVGSGQWQFGTTDNCLSLPE